MFDNHLLRLEDEMTHGDYTVRAEIPGVDPAKDVGITVRDGRLTINADRSETTQSDGRSEFPTVRSSGQSRYPPVPMRTTSMRPMRREF
jgi:HSP20 family molecular chaperone IbpA